LTDAAEHHSRWFKRPWFVVSASLVLAGVIVLAKSDSVRFVVCSTAQLFIYGMPQPQDVEEADEITKIITVAHSFTQNSLSQPDRAPVFSNAGSMMFLTQPTQIEVYGIRDRAEQDRVISTVKDAVRDKKFKPVDLQFMDDENWIVRGNGGERGSELQLRRVRVSQGGTHELSGQKMITYPVP